MPVQIGDLVLYSISEISEALNINPHTFRRYIREGKVKGQKVGNKWYISEESLREFFRATPEAKPKANGQVHFAREKSG